MSQVIDPLLVAAVNGRQYGALQGLRRNAGNTGYEFAAGVWTDQSYANPSWLTSIANAKVTGLGALATLGAAPAGTVTGTTLAANVVTSSLTTIGTLVAGSIPYSLVTGGPAAVSGANPSASVGLAAVNGSAATFMRSDGTPALDQGIVPTWTGKHVHSLSNASAWAIGPNGDTNPVLRIVTNTASQADGLSVTGLAAGSGVTLAALSSGSNAPITLIPKGTGDGILGCMRSFVEGTQQVAVSVQNASAPAGGDRHTLYLGQTAYTQYLRGGFGLDMTINNGGGTNLNLTANFPSFVNLQQSGTTLLSVGGNVGAQGVVVTQMTAASVAFTIQAIASSAAPLVQFQGTSSTTAGRAQAEVDTAWSDSTDATRSADLILRAYYTTTAREGIRIRGGSSNVQLGFYGVTPISRALLATGAGHAVDDVITALQNLGLVKQS